MVNISRFSICILQLDLLNMSSSLLIPITIKKKKILRVQILYSIINQCLEKMQPSCWYLKALRFILYRDRRIFTFRDHF